MKNSKTTILTVFATITLAFIGCNSQQPGGQVIVNAATPTVSAGDNFNLQALGELTKRCQTSKDLEDSINKPGGINNLVMPGDSTVSYIHVKDYSDVDGNKGFKLYVIMPDNSTQDIATVNIQAPTGSNNTATMNINGNPGIYTNGNACYSANYSLGELLFWSYILSSHYGYYTSPYGYGMYPPYYHRYGYRPYSSYSGYTHIYTRSSRITTVTTTTKKTPSFNNSSNYTKQRDIANRTQSARDYSVRNSSKPISTGGFSSKSSGSSNSSKSSSSFGSGSKSSGRSFGGSKSSFGSHSSGGRRH